MSKKLLTLALISLLTLTGAAIYTMMATTTMTLVLLSPGHQEVTTATLPGLVLLLPMHRVAPCVPGHARVITMEIRSRVMLLA